ncbi:MAG: Bacterial type II secretion system protein F domain protein [Chloroflexi bacterium ADurb.Bin360]|nr:MAG: Bacterial type II secretion system protein F domain protein [Chloroflexi bacterium ADurb.Bin360]
MAGIIALVVLLVGATLFLVLRGRGSNQSLDDRLEEMATLGQPISLEKLELSQPFTERVIKPMMQSLSALIQRTTPQQLLEQARHQLEMAGVINKIKPAQFVGIRLVTTVVGGIVGIILAGSSQDSGLGQKLLMVGGGIVFGYIMPQYMLTSQIRKRQESVLKALPDALDLLTICVEAGLGFDAAMSKVADKWDNELSLAFTRAVQEMQLGKLRREALRDMASSLDVGDVTSFVAAIVQADQLGVSMAKVMRIQSEQMRMKRRQRAEEKARQAPVKIMLPLVFFIFPTILIVLLGPAILQIKESGIFGG